jgi:putative tryptophan/tyrosine transport system substrate-binding protein
MISRRAVLAALTADLLAAPFGETQQTKKAHQIGYLGGSSRAAPLMESFRQGLRDLGYVENRNMILTIRWGEASPERLRNFAAELVLLGVDVIVAGPDSSIAAAKQATKTIPIVMVLPTDPVHAGFVTSLARPGANVTGLTLEIGTQIHGKRLELLKEAFPTTSRVAVLGNPAFAGRPSYSAAIDAAARSLGVTVRFIDVREPRDLDAAFQSLTRQRPEALFVVSDPLVYSQREQLVELVSKLRLPAMYSALDWAEAGGLMAYGPSRADLMRRAATYVDRILKGARPADLPVEQPTKFELVINLRTAKSSASMIPQSILLQADQVIE